MGHLIFFLIAIIIGINIFIKTGVNKLQWFFFGILFFPSTIEISDSPHITFPRFVIYCLYFSFIFQNKNIKKSFNAFPLYIPLVLMFISLLLVGLFDNRIDAFAKILRPLYYFAENFLIVFITYFYTKSLRDVKKIYHFLVICFLIFGVYGVFNYFSGVSLYNVLISEIYKTQDFANSYTISGDARFRISSFAVHPIYYGLLLSFTILFLVFQYYERKLQVYNSFFYSTLVILLFINLLWTNSRTPLLSFLIGVSFFYIFGIKLGSKIRIFFIGFFVIVSIVFISPKSLNLITESFNTFTSNGSKLEGSSVEMRETQMASTFLIYNKSPFFGNGINYITEDLGFSSNQNIKASEGDLGGFESYIYKLMIEQGLIGIFANIFFFISVFIYLLKMREKVDLLGKKVIYFTLSMTITFILFIIGTGDLGGFVIYMALLGINIKFATMCSKTQFNFKNFITAV